MPVRIVWAPRETALREEAQTLFIVVQGTESGREAAREHWREGFWPMLWRVLVFCEGEGMCGCRR